jgi:hypothetical protein
MGMVRTALDRSVGSAQGTCHPYLAGAKTSYCPQTPLVLAQACQSLSPLPPQREMRADSMAFPKVTTPLFTGRPYQQGR